jgi:methionyl aminopeptidase
MTRIGYEMGVILKSPREIGQMREAGLVAAAVLDRVVKEVRPGVTTGYLDNIAVREVSKRGATASFKGYRSFPASICASVNEEVVHGIPGSRVLEEGDIISLDFGAFLNGFHGDAAVTVGVGKISAETRKLIDATRGALEAGIAAAKMDGRLGDISAAIQSYAESRNFSVVREWVGHGIGRDLHEDPQVPNFGIAGEGISLRQGITLALEPMLNAGIWSTKIADDKWTVVTADGMLSAHFEHTIAIGENGAEILTAI